MQKAQDAKDANNALSTVTQILGTLGVGSLAYFLLNNKKCNYPSASLKPGDTIKVRDKSKKVDSIMVSMKRIKGDIELPWLELDKAKMTGTFLAVPERDEMALTINEQLVVELYSK